VIDPAVSVLKLPVEALIVPTDKFITDMLLELMTETDSGEVTRPVFVIVVIPATVERLIPAPAAKFALMLPVMVVLLMNESHSICPTTFNSDISTKFVEPNIVSLGSAVP
jgi:hypothetical protein